MNTQSKNKHGVGSLTPYVKMWQRSQKLHEIRILACALAQAEDRQLRFPRKYPRFVFSDSCDVQGLCLVVISHQLSYSEFVVGIGGPPSFLQYIFSGISTCYSFHSLELPLFLAYVVDSYKRAG